MKLLLLLISAVLIAVASVVIFRSVTISSRQVQSIPANSIILDTKVLAGRLGMAVQFQTISYEDRARFNEAQFKGFQKFLEQAFPKVHAAMTKEIVGDYSLLYTWKGRDDKELPILLAAHMDVVPAESEAGSNWTYPPFQGQIADGFIWGRGTLDDKVSVLGILEAMEKLLQDGYAPSRTIYIAFGHDEEIGGQHGAAKIAALLNSRQVKLDYVLDEGLTITEGLVPNISKPVALVGIAEKGCLSIELSVESEGGHSMMPPKQTAIGILSSAISKLEQKQFPTRMEVPVRKMFETLSPEMPFGMKIVFANLWLFESLVKNKLASAPRTNALVRTTVAPTIFQAGVKENILATKARAIINYRLLPGDTINKVLLKVQKTVNDPRVKITVSAGFNSDPSNIADTGSKGYRTVEQAIRQVFPQALVAPGLVIAATDSRHYSAMTRNILHFSPIRLRSDDLRRIHGTDERISVEDYKNVVRFYAQLIGNEGTR
ncbi:MAG: M20 family peptidase [Deltaproteobacteria bacterium]|nr:M20 family peptidase [Deltaproteobacteria bacterium]